MENNIELPGDFDIFMQEAQKAIELKQNTNVLNKKINEELSNRGLSSTDDLVVELPRTRSLKGDEVVLVRADNIGLTSSGELTRVDFIGKLKNKSDIYGDIAFTPSEVEEISKSYRILSTGPNSVLPMRCIGRDCSFANSCPYVKIDKAPVGKGCLVEYDLLAFHTEKLIEQFEIDPSNHVELMLVQEISETYVLEMRLNRVLAEPENAEMRLVTTHIGKTDSFDVEDEHWAIKTKEKFKTRRMKLLESLNATRASVKQTVIDDEADGNTYYSKLSELKNMITKIKNSESIEITEILESKKND